MKKRYIQILIFLCFVLYFPALRVVGQKSIKEKTITIESVVKDEKGNPIKGAIIYGKEGFVVSKTDANGKFSITVPEKTDLLIESDGYESLIYKSGEYEKLTEFSLKASMFGYGSKDDVNLAFRKIKKGDVVGAVSVLNPEDFLQYDNNQDVYEALSNRLPGMLGSSNLRGIGKPLFIVDGLPRDPNGITMDEIEQITVLKDINSSILFGNAAVNGVVMITTKRGKAYKNQINVSGYYGIATPKALPKYLSSSDYMTLYNEARKNDGLSAPYSQTMIDTFRTGNPYHYPNVDYYSNDYLKAFKPISRITTELMGGNDIVTYYSNLRWDQTGSLLNFGEGKNGKSNTFSARGNIDVKVNSFVKSSLDAVAIYNNNTGAVGRSYWSDASTLQPNLFAPLIPISQISLADPKTAGYVKARINDIDGMYLLGGTTVNPTNPIANGYSGGALQSVSRLYSINNRTDFDLKQIVPGLAFHTNLSFDLLLDYDQQIQNTYAVYSPVWSTTMDSIVSLSKVNDDTRPGVQAVGNSSFERRFGGYGLLDYDRTFGGMHHFSSAFSAYANMYKRTGELQGTKDANLGLRFGYGYKNRYLLDFSGTYVNSTKLPAGNRAAFSPSLGLAWIISSEKFMSAVPIINYLKFRASGGITNSDLGIAGFFYYDPVYVRSGTYYWSDRTYNNSGTVPSYGGNNQLGFEKRKEVNVGFEGLFFDKMVGIDANIFMSQYYDQITRTQTLYPSFYSSFIPYTNFDNNEYRGAELGINIHRNIGDFSFSLGAKALYSTSKVIKRDEIYADTYQNRTGRSVDAMFGLVSEGFFNDKNDIDTHAIQAFGSLQPGDIKYVDQNGDGIIDTNDEVQIGRSQAPFSYGLNLNLSYKNFTLFAQGTGVNGADSYINGDYYWVDSNDKYSAYVLNRWTEETKTTATFPRLSSLANNNNFRNSTFWLYQDNVFTLNRVQLTYEMPDKISQKLQMKKISLYVDGTSLLTFSKYREIKELRVNNEPYLRTFSVGVKTIF